MQKAEYRYYEISQDLPVMALSGKKWEYLFVSVWCRKSGFSMAETDWHGCGDCRNCHI